MANKINWQDKKKENGHMKIFPQKHKKCKRDRPGNRITKLAQINNIYIYRGVQRKMPKQTND